MTKNKKCETLILDGLSTSRDVADVNISHLNYYWHVRLVLGSFVVQLFFVITAFLIFFHLIAKNASKASYVQLSFRLFNTYCETGF